ncbi:MAG TPA: hypothetical protein ENK42_06260 [Deltaproteobacteria bacterium]|nr:hypothetical protein [Deltaproteobacteria bacterium]
MKNLFCKVSLVVFVFILSLAGYAGGAELDDVRRELERQQRLIEELKRKVEELEKIERLKAIRTKEEEEMGPQFGRNLGAFGDISFLTDSRERQNPTFSIGSLGLYTSASYRERLNFLFEMIVYAHNNRSGVNLERLWVGYTFSDAFIIRAGRFHTALGRWNKSYHHARHLFPTVDRPFFLKFESIGGVMPVHIVGMELAGSKELSYGKLKYWIEVGNGPGFRKDRHKSIFAGGDYKLAPNNMFDTNHSKQVAMRIYLEPSSIEGLGVGVSGTNFKVGTSNRSITVNEGIYGIDLKYVIKGVEVMGEFFLFTNGTAQANAWYLQLSRPVERFTPYARVEVLDGEDGDPYLSNLSGGKDRTQYIMGLRYAIDLLHSSLKFQYRYDSMDGEKIYNVFETQWAFHF